MESWPFKVVDEDGTPKIEVEYLGGSHKFSAQEISAMVLTKASSAPLSSTTLTHMLTSPTDEGDC
jgi:molecular chaperone DnaK (HSP70)